MSVAFYAPLKPPDHPVPSGDRHMARMLCAALQEAGYSVQLASRFRAWEGRGDRARQRRLRTVGERLAGRLARRWLAVAPDARPRAWFTYHLYHKAPDWLGPIVSEALAIPYLVAEPSHAASQLDGPWSEGCRAAERALCAADRLLVVNGNDLEALRRLPVPETRIVRLQPFVDAGRYRSVVGEQNKLQLAAEHDLDPGLPWLLAVGMLRPGDKLASYAQLAEALAGLQDLPWRLIVIGDGPARQQVEELLVRCLPERFRLVGLASQAQIREWLGAADLLVWPAVNEAYGMALLEAQAAGLPVVSAAVGGVGDVVAHGETGLLSSGGDRQAFAAHVRRLLMDPALRARFAYAAQDRVTSRHDIAQAAGVLGEVLGGLGVQPQNREGSHCLG